MKHSKTWATSKAIHPDQTKATIKRLFADFYIYHLNCIFDIFLNLVNKKISLKCQESWLNPFLESRKYELKKIIGCSIFIYSWHLVIGPSVTGNIQLPNFY